MHYTSGQPMSPEETRAELKDLMQKYAAPGNTFWVWAVEERRSTAFVGTCALVLNEEREYEIGFRIRETFWGQGIGKEIAGPLLQHGFHKMGMDKIYGYVDKENVASMKILERFMTFEKEYYNDRYQCMDRKYYCTAKQLLVEE